MDSRAWRTAFLTLRDETLHLSDSPKPIGELLDRLIFSQSNSLVSASPLLPDHELTSDLLFLLELAASSRWTSPEFPPVFSHITRLMHDVCRGQRVSLQLNSSSWACILDSFASMLQLFLKKPAASTPSASLDSEAFTPAMNCLELVRHLVSSHKDKFSEADDVHLGMFLLQIIECSHDLLPGNSFSCQKSSVAIRKGSAKNNTLFEFQTLAYAMLGEATTRLGASLPADFWHSAIKVLRKVLDALLSGSSLSDDRTMSRLYIALLNCLHVVLAHPKGSLADHVSGFVATLRMFFLYGLGSKLQFRDQTNGWKEKEPVAVNHKLSTDEPGRKNQAPYRPPHLRKRENLNSNRAEPLDSSTFSENEYSALVSTSSDSDCSDNDGSLKDVEEIQYSKVRICAIVCIQDLCEADPKAFTGQWVMLLPTNDVLNSRKFEATLMTCLLFDPYMKTRIASASVLAVMLDRPSSTFLQIAEYNESTKWGSFMPLASSLGCILMQLHTGILHMIQRERHSRLLASLFKILVLLISSTPYARMPVELLPTVITSISAKIENEATSRGDQTCHTVSVISCLAAALSTSPPSPQVKRMLLKEISASDTTVNEKRSAVLSTLFWYSEQVTNPAPCSEALQAVRAMAHNYPSVVIGCWKQISCIIFKVLALASPEITSRTWKNQIDNAFIGEKIITGAIKVLDESMRALCGFKGTEDLADDKLFETPSFTSECTRTKKVSSAPSFEPGNEEDTEGEPHSLTSGNECWSQTIENVLPQFLRHPSGMVRTASFTCFAGITSSAFFSLTKDKQEVIASALIDASVHDKAPSVRSAACRAIGVISCFQQFPESAEIFGKMINAIKINTHDPLISVRIIASWALANICNSLHHYVDNSTLKEHRDLNASAEFTALLAECALRLTKDGDKVKSNAVRALGNISRFVKYQGSSGMPDKLMGSLVLSSSMELPATVSLQSGPRKVSRSCDQTLLDVPCLLEKIVQAFLSCVTSGNVKVQWNVCHALSNLFLNETLRLQDMDWAPSVFSILLLLLRDSSNFKIKIQAASALAVPASVIDYGKSFSDVVQVLVHILENLSSIQISEPSSFKYRVALEKQMAFTVLHVLALASSADHETLKDFLVKKAIFLEDWFKAVSSSLEEPTNTAEGSNPASRQKRWMISRALRSLVQVYEKTRHHGVAQKFEKLDESIGWQARKSTSPLVLG